MFTLWPVRRRPPSSSRVPAMASTRVVLPVPFGPTSDTCSPRSSQSSPSSRSTRPPGTSSRASAISSTTRPVRSAGPNSNPSVRVSVGARSMRSIF